MVNVEIITIGDEILIGQVVDTNSAWMGQKLNEAGIEVRQITSVHDQKEQIISSIEDALGRSEVVLLTGGLGPTRDDITKTTLSEYFESPMILHEETLRRIEEFVEKRGGEMNELNRSQAMVPAACQPLPNPFGTAPGMLFRKEGRLVFSLPGVPYEMKYLMENEVIPLIRNEFKTEEILHRTLLIHGLPESVLATRLEDWEDHKPAGLKVAYLPAPGRIRLRLSINGSDRKALESVVEKEIEKLFRLLPGYISSTDEEFLPQLIGRLLKEKKQTLSTAESCTGGSIAAALTSVPGASAYFKGSVVAYANEVKMSMLNVSGESLNRFGAVSKEVVEEMAQGCRMALKTDYAIAVSGIAGPDGGSEEKPVGTVWIAVAGLDRTHSGAFKMGNQRLRTIEKSVLAGLEMLRQVIVNY
jgi:nicotinamide-nucleotide amidase